MAERQEARHYVLTVAHGGAYRVSEGGLQVGTVLSNSIILPGPYVASHHAAVWTHGEHCYIHDWGTGALTMVNGQRVTGTVRIYPGDLVAFGNWTFRLSTLQAIAMMASQTSGGSGPRRPTRRADWVLSAAVACVATFLVLMTAGSLWTSRPAEGRVAALTPTMPAAQPTAVPTSTLTTSRASQLPAFPTPSVQIPATVTLAPTRTTTPLRP